MEDKMQLGNLDLFSFFMFEASGESGTIYSDNPSSKLVSDHIPFYYYEWYNAHARGDIEDDAESNVFGSSLPIMESSSPVDLCHGLDDHLEGQVSAKDDAEVSRVMSEDDGRGSDHCTSFISTAGYRQQHHRSHVQENSCLSDESISEDRSRSGDRDRKKTVPDDSGCKHLTEKEKDKLFWEACLAS